MRDAADAESHLAVNQNLRCHGHSLGGLLTAVDEDREAVHSDRDNLKTMGIMDAAYLSAERGGALVAVGEALGAPLRDLRRRRWQTSMRSARGAPESSADKRRTLCMCVPPTRPR